MIFSCFFDIVVTSSLCFIDISWYSKNAQKHHVFAQFLKIGLFGFSIRLSWNFAARGMEISFLFQLPVGMDSSSIFQWFWGRFAVRNRCKMPCEKELDMRSEKKGFQTTQGPPQEVSRRPRTLQGLEVGANLAPRGVPKSIQNRSKSELASPQDPRPSRDSPKILKWTPKWVPNRCEINFEIHSKFIQLLRMLFCFLHNFDLKIGGTAQR